MMTSAATTRCSVTTGPALAPCERAKFQLSNDSARAPHRIEDNNGGIEVEENHWYGERKGR